LLDRSVESLTGVGPKVAERLAKLGVRTLGDLLCLLPQRYEDRTAIKPIGSLAVGEKALVEGVVELSEVAYRRRRSLLARVADGTGAVTLRFFYFNKSVEQALARGRRVRCYGEVRSGPAGLEMVHPEHRAVVEDEAEPSDRLTPVYPTTEGLYQQTLRRIVARAVAALEHETLEDYLAPQVLAGAPWPSLAEALAYLHSPPRDAATELLLSGRHPCSRRIARELVAQRLSLRRAAAVTLRAGSAAAGAGRAARCVRAALPFELTRAQAAAFDEIVGLNRDADEPAPAGDVGSGRTVVAAMAALVAAAAQTAVMAPTDCSPSSASRASTAGQPLGIEVAADRRAARARDCGIAAVAAAPPSSSARTHCSRRASRFGSSRSSSSTSNIASVSSSGASSSRKA
jgi:ATP-dependent DNA helicase RecG